MRKVCFVISEVNITQEPWLIEVIGRLEQEYHIAVLVPGSASESLSSHFLNIACKPQIISAETDILSFLRSAKFNIICDLSGQFSGRLLKIAYRAGVQLRIAYFSDSCVQYKSKLNSRLTKKYATRILGNTEAILKEIFDSYRTYSLQYKVIENLTGDEYSLALHVNLKNEIESPLRAEGIKLENPIIRFLWTYVKRYDHSRYWEMRYQLVSNRTISKIRKFWYLYCIKKIDAFHNCSFGTNLNSGASFATPPFLPHGPNGIIIGHDTVIGREVVIYHHVTVMHGNVKIGNNVMLGAGCKVLPNVTIGNNVKVGANCVVVEDVPDGATVVLPKPRIILSDE